MNRKKAFAYKLVAIAMTVLLTLNTSPLSIWASTMPSAQTEGDTYAIAPVAGEAAASSEEGGSASPEPSTSADSSAADDSAAAENKPAEGEAASASSATTESATNESASAQSPAASNDPAAASDPVPADDSSPNDDARAPETFDGNNYLTNLKFSLRAGDISKTYELKAGETVDTRADFPDGLPRSVKYSAELNIDTESMLKAQGKYPFVTGDKVTVRIPDLIHAGAATKGRLRDSTAEWDSANNGVGNYEVTQDAEGHNILTITYDDGYVAEKNGKILSSSVKLSGGFDTSKETTESFDTTLTFGALNVLAQFSKLEVIRNLSIEKTCATDEYGPYFSSSSPSYPRQGGASLDSEGYLTYTVTLKAGEDNTYSLKNVEVTDVFDGESKYKVDLSTMKLDKVLVDGENKTSSATALRDTDGNINGWNIGDLPIGTSATVTFKVKPNKDGITAAVDAAKAADPATDVVEARTIKNTATAKADDTDPVTDDCSVIVKNYVWVSKSTASFDAATQREHFSITVTAPRDNRYTQHDVPIHDYVSGGLDAKYYKASGIQSATVRHADGTTETVQCENYSQAPNSKSWYATIPELRPGDTVTIDAYLELDESYWTNPAGAGKVGYYSYCWNYAHVGNIGEDGYRSDDLNRHYDDSYFQLIKNVLTKNNPSISSDGTVNWVITGNEYGKTREQENIGGLVLNDTLGPNQEFTGNKAHVTFYNEDGSVAGADSIDLPAGSTSFSYTIPAEYGTCSYRISYASKITDWESYVGPAKGYTNTVNGVTGATYERARVAAMTKKFVKQADDWSQWQTSIYSELEDGDTYTDTSRSGVGYMYFTQGDLDAITLSIDGATVDTSLYQIEPLQANAAGDQFASYKITFKGGLAVEKDGKTLKPSKDHPLVIDYKAHMVNPPSSTRVYYNDATLTAGTVVDRDNDYCKRANNKELYKSVESSSNGRITWLVRANFGGYSSQPDGTCVITDTLPKGVAFESLEKQRGVGEVESVTPTVNDDGTTTLTIKAKGLYHDEVCKDHPSDYNGSSANELYLLIKTNITDPEFLYGSESKDFRFTNSVSLNDRYGNPKKDSATATIKHVAMKKGMVYDEATAPYAEFSIEANNDRLDLNPDGDTVGIVDESSKSLAVDLKSIEVVNAKTGEPVDFTVDASKMANNQFTVHVPDNTYVKITYRAQVLGPVGSNVGISNSAYYEGHKTTRGESAIEKTVSVLDASGQVVSVPMVWLSKKDESAKALGGATYRLDEYDETAGTWKTLRSSIVSTDNNNAKGVKVEDLEINKLYRFVETKAPAGYVLDATPHYFVLYRDAAPTVTYPDGVNPDDVFQGPSGSLISAYDRPYTPVRFVKTSDDGVQLAGAKFSVYPVAEDGTVSADPALDEDGNKVSFTSSADAMNEFMLAPGTYQLKETKAPAGYDTAEPVTFEVMGDANRTVMVNGKIVQSGTGDAITGGLGMTDVTAKTSLHVTKAWDDYNNFDGMRPQSATVQLFADGTAVDGKTATLTADNGWAISFDGLDVMKQGKQVSYTVKEIDPTTGNAVDSGSTLSCGYKVTVSDTAGDVASGADTHYSTTVTNAYIPKTTSVTVSKTWDDANDQDGVRPMTATFQLFADGQPVQGKAVSLSAGNNWTATIDGLAAAHKDGTAIVYTVKEIDSTNGNVVDFDGSLSNGYKLQLTSAAYAGYPAGINPTGIDAATDAPATDGQQPTRSIRYEVSNVRKPAKTSIAVDKKWIGPAAASATVKLQFSDNDGLTWADLDGAEATLTEGNGWSATFADLPVYAPGMQGIKRTYRVVEDAIDNYRVEYRADGQESDGVVEPVAGKTESMTVINTNVEKTRVNGAKTWEDAGNQDGMRPQSIAVRLLADGEEIDSKTLSAADATADNADVWSFSFDGLAKYDPIDGHEYVYTVEETAVPEGYAASVNGYSIVNTHEPATTSIEVAKQWVGPAAASATVRLQASIDDGATWTDLDGAAVTLAGDNGWSAAFTDLPVYAPGEQGVKRLYRVVEDSMDNYEASYRAADQDSDGVIEPMAGETESMTVVNTNVEKTSVNVTKVWADKDNRDGARPQSITVRLLADGEEIDSKTVTAADAVTGSANAWSFSFDDLAKYDPADGHEYAYAIKEDAVDGYTTKLEGNVEDGFVITNTMIEKPAAPKDDKSKKKTRGGLPRTGDASALLPIVLSAGATASFACALCAKRRSRRE